MDPSTLHLVLFTALMAALAVALILPMGVALAWVLARKVWRGKSVVETLASLPLALPPVATGLILLKLFSRRGLLGPMLGTLGLEVIFTWKAVVLAMAVMAFPLLVRTARTAFEAVDPRLEGVARTLGAKPMRVFWTITLPLSTRGVASGAVLAYARALGEFGATVLVAGNIEGRTTTLPVAIFQSIELGRDADAMHLMMFSVVLSFAALWVSGRIGRITNPPVEGMTSLPREVIP
jgi:molybdate transport system permease protein